MARAETARASRPRVMPPREAKITAETMAAVFDGHSLFRKETVAALVVRAGVSVAAAYNALSLEGRFKAHLAESGGNFIWEPATNETAAEETRLRDFRCA